MSNISKLAELAKNVRAGSEDDLDELIDSMKHFGWLDEFPALADEHGAILVGNRRMKAAKKAGVEPVVRTITFGAGEKADAQRVKFALVSNLGSKPMSREDRQRIAEHLYGNKEWTMERIAEALNVSIATVGVILGNFLIMRKLEPPRRQAIPKGQDAPRAAVSQSLPWW
jgi:ParB-like chromosome segregation protein Spo0J